MSTHTTIYSTLKGRVVCEFPIHFPHFILITHFNQDPNLRGYKTFSFMGIEKPLFPLLDNSNFKQNKVPPHKFFFFLLLKTFHISYHILVRIVLDLNDHKIILDLNFRWYSMAPTTLELRYEISIFCLNNWFFRL